MTTIVRSLDRRLNLQRRRTQDVKELGAKIQRLREENGLTMEQLAKRFGVSLWTIKRILKERRESLKPTGTV